MRARTLTRSAADVRLAWGSAALAGSGALFVQSMAPQALAVLRFGQICTGHPAFALHCPACYVAAAIAACAVGFMASTLVGVRTAAGR